MIEALGRVRPPPLLAIICVLSSPSLHAVEPQFLIVSSRLQRMESADGGSLQVDWIGAFETGTLTLGMQRTDVGSSRWTLISVGGARTLSHGRMLTGGVDNGPAVINGEPVNFRKARVQLSVPCFAKWRCSIGDTFIDVEPIFGQMLNVGTSLTMDSGAAVALDYFDAIGGSLVQHQLSVKYRYPMSRLRLATGLAIGSTNSLSESNVPSASAEATRTKLGYAAIGIPVSGMELTIGLEAAKTGGIRRLALSAAIRLPLTAAR